MFSAVGVREQSAGEKFGRKNGEETRGQKTLLRDWLLICSHSLMILRDEIQTCKVAVHAARME